jgi:hypothetical protein
MNWVNSIPNLNDTLVKNKTVGDVSIHDKNASLAWDLDDVVINLTTELLMDLIAQPEGQPTQSQSKPPTTSKDKQSRGSVEYVLPFYLNVSEQALSGLMMKAKTVTYLKVGLMDEVRPQSLENSVCIVFSGKVSVVGDESTESFHINNTDACVNEIAVLPNQLLEPASNVTFERAVFAIVAKPDVISWLKEYPDVTFNLSSGRERLPSDIPVSGATVSSRA